MSVTDSPLLKAAGRLPGHPSYRIDPARPLTFEFDGRSYQALAGDTIASALWAAGVRVLGRSFKYHRPRGPFALTAGDSNALVRVNGEPNVRAGVRLVEEGMVVEPQNVWPSLQADALSLSQLLSPFMPVGFYYKAFMQPQSLWPAYETFLRHAAGLGYVTTDIPTTYYDKTYEFADVLVIGGGPAGMRAALSAAGSGARVMLVEEQPYLGGHLAYEHQMVRDEAGEAWAGYALGLRLAGEVESHSNIRVALQTVAFGLYDQLWVGAVQEDRRLLKIRAKSVVVASGAYEQPLLFENSDLPGVVLGSAAQRLMHLYGVKPGQRAGLLSANRDGLQCALDLLATGVKLAAVIELRPNPDADLVEQLADQGVAIRSNSIVTKAHGRHSLTGVIVAKAELEEGTGQVRLDKGNHEFISCDLLVVSIGWTPAVGLLAQAKAKLAYAPARHEFLPAELPPRVHAAGRVAGLHDVRTELLAGQLAGLNAAAEAGFGQKAPADLARQVDQLKRAEPVRTSSVIYVPGNAKKSFISFDEDVSIQDLRDAVVEGYDSMELLKRYSTLSMGPSQGKYESLNTMALYAEATQQSMADTGPTTSRPPVSPVPLGVLAGRVMEPVKVTPMHTWHLARSATMMNVGLWKRPEHYGDPAAEVIATRTALGLIDVSTLGKIQMKGPDVPALLERLYTNKWTTLKPGQARYGVMCNEEGVVADDGVAARLDEESWYVTATSGGVAALYENIQWNLQSGWNLEVHLANLTDAWAAMNLTGPRAQEALQPLTDIDLSNGAFPYMAVRQGAVAGVPVTVLRIGFTGELGYELHAPAGYGLYLWETLMEAGQAYGITPLGVEAQRIMRLEKGHFIVGQDTDGLTDPLMANLAWAVKLDKPDFVGKPSLVRIEQRGISQKLVGFEMVNPKLVPEEANQIVVDNPAEPVGLEIIGRVTSARYSPTLKKSIGLCWLPAERSQPGAEFTVRIRGELHPGRVVSLPFYDPAGEKLRG